MSDEHHVFTASRLTNGNSLFPVRIEITAQHVSRIKPHFIGSEEESMPLSKVASVSIRTGFFFSEIRIDSTAGATPILSRGHWKNDAKRIREIIETLQNRR